MRWTRCLFLCFLALFLIACGDENLDESGIADSDVQITLPPQFFSGQDEDTIREDAENQGIKGVEILEDGSVTYTLTKERHQEIIEEYKEELDYAISNIASSESFPSIKKVEASDDYKNFNIYVDRALFEKSGDMVATITLYIASSYYHAFLDGVKNLKVNLNYIDEATGEAIQTVELPKDEETNK